MNKLTQTLRSGLIATSLSAALVLGGALIASAQSTSHEQASPATQQTAPDSSAKPMSEQPNMGAQQATPQDRDTMGQQPTTTPDNDQATRQDRDRQDRDMNRDRDRDRSKNAKNDNDTTRRELAAFDHFLDKHPQISQELQKDPQKINDESWVSSHKDLSKYLKEHPQVREELRENPSAFMNRENRYEKNETRPNNPQ